VIADSSRFVGEFHTCNVRSSHDEFVDAHLRGARFERVDMTGAQLRRVDLTDARFQSVDLSRVVMRGVDLIDVEIHARFRIS